MRLNFFTLTFKCRVQVHRSIQCCSADVRWGSQSKWEKIVLNTAVSSPLRREEPLRHWIIVAYIGSQINGKTSQLSGLNRYYAFHAVPL